MRNAKFLAMQQAVIDYINSRIPEDPNKAHIGTVDGGRVVIGEKSFPFKAAVDLFFGDGNRVACIRPDNSSSAVVVGVL